MRSIHPTFAAIALFSILYDAESTPLALHATAALLVSASDPSTPNCDRYEALPPGQTTYEIDDGGCFFCGKFPGSTTPLSGDDLATHCQKMCDSDPKCISFAIARPAIQDAHEYHWGTGDNCCLDRTHHPNELWVNGYVIDDGVEPNECQTDAMCWTRMERKTECNIDEAPLPSENCSLVWKKRKYTEKQIKKKIDFIEKGCPFGGDEVFKKMAKEAYDQCKLEAEAEMGLEKVVKQPLSSPTLAYPNSHRSAWVAHGSIGFIVFGLIVPASLFSAIFRDVIPIYMNAIIFAMTFFTVSIAFGTMSSMGSAGEGHLKEIHHLVGLLLLLLVSFQTAHACSRPPLERFPDEERDAAAGAKLELKINDNDTTAFKLWYLLHGAIGLFIFFLGTYQVRSGLGLFSKRFGAPDRGTLYIFYIGLVIVTILIGKLHMAWNLRKLKLNAMEIQMASGGVTYIPQMRDEQCEFA